jgi:HlyD family secretion protein
MNNANTDPQVKIEHVLGLDSSGNGRSRFKRWLVWGVLILLVVLVGMKFIFGKKGTEMLYTTQAVTKGSLTITVSATGNLAPINQVDVGSELSGIIDSVSADYNDQVTAGQVLAKLDTSKLESQVLKSRASLASARAKVLEAQATVQEAENENERLKAVQKLSGGKAVSQHDLDAAAAVLERAVAVKADAEASVSQAQATLDSDETDLSKALIQSPINGVVLVRSVEPGQTVAASLQAPVLFTLAEDLTQMELHVDVDEADVGQVKEGQVAEFTVDAYPERRFPAEIKQVRYGSKTVGGVVTYETVLHVTNADLSLRPGMTATADIIVQKIDDAVLVPNSALRFEPPATEESVEEDTGGSVLSKLFPRRHRPAKKRMDDKQKRVWKLENGQPVPIAVKGGATDGVKTEIIDGDVSPGVELVVDSRSAKQ